MEGDPDKFPSLELNIIPLGSPTAVKTRGVPVTETLCWKGWSASKLNVETEVKLGVPVTPEGEGRGEFGF